MTNTLEDQKGLPFVNTKIRKQHKVQSETSMILNCTEDV